MNKFLKAVCLSVCLAVGSLVAQAQTSPSVITKSSTTSPSFVLATNLASFAKNSTNNANIYITSTNTYLGSLVPLPLNGRALNITATMQPAGALIGTSNIVVGFDYSDGINYTTTVTPLSITIAANQFTNVTQSYIIPATNFYGQTYIIPTSLNNAGLTNGTMLLRYQWIYP